MEIPDQIIYNKINQLVDISRYKIRKKSTKLK